MRIIGRILGGLALLVVLAVAGVAIWLAAAPPELIRVGSGYTAKIVCSNVFVAGRDPDAVLAVDVQAPGHWLLKYLAVDVDRDAKTVTAGLLGLFGKSIAVARDGLGCANVPDGNRAALAAVSAPPPGAPANPQALWPEGETVQSSNDPLVAAILDDTTLTGPGMRAVVVVKDGRIVGERYGADFAATTPLLGWSMAKTVTAALVGTVIADGRLSLEKTALLPAWSDGRSKISVGDLMAMSSGLVFNEEYGDVTDVTRMLYLEPDMARFAAAAPLQGEPSKTFEYSTGTAILLARIWQDAIGDQAEALAWPRRRLFEPLGMTSAVMETDESGTFVGGSYIYATARDWARFGQFLIQDGVWNGQAILPPGFVAWMREPAPASNGRYRRGQLWVQGPEFGALGKDPMSFGLPDDTYWMIGHDGQTVAIVPSERLVVVRMGLTPYKNAFQPQAMLKSLIEVLG